MRIAIFDYLVTATNPAGSCHLKMLEELCHEHDFTVFSVRFENPCPERIRWVRVPAPQRPLALLFVVFHLLAPILYWLHRFRSGVRFDLRQGIESNTLLADTAYAHFCHATYLRDHWRDSGMHGLRRLFRFADHKLHALMEPLVYRRAKAVVVPSRGLARELAREYPWVAPRLMVLPNPVDLELWRKPSGFDSEAVRRGIGLDPHSFVLSFVALGQFERKGLPLLLSAIAEDRDPRLQLLVIGGNASTVDEYRGRCGQMGISDGVRFTGMQTDVRPFLWACDAFALPSSYEVFPLVCLQGAAAGLPLLVSQLNGVEEFLIDGVNGILTGRTVAEIRRSLAAIRALTPAAREAMGQRARQDVERFAVANFTESWREFYRGYSAACRRPVTHAELTAPSGRGSVWGCENITMVSSVERTESARRRSQ